MKKLFWMFRSEKGVCGSWKSIFMDSLWCLILFAITRNWKKIAFYRTFIYLLYFHILYKFGLVHTSLTALHVNNTVLFYRLRSVAAACLIYRNLSSFPPRQTKVNREQGFPWVRQETRDANPAGFDPDSAFSKTGSGFYLQDKNECWSDCNKDDNWSGFTPILSVSESKKRVTFRTW